MQFRFHHAAALAVSLGSALLFGRVVSVGQDTDLETFRKLHAELRERMSEDLGEATKFLESKIAAEPDSADLNVLRHSLASKLIQQRDFPAATEQFKKLLDFQINHVDQTENRFGIWMTIQSLQRIADDSGNWTEFHRAVERSFQTLKEAGPDEDLQAMMPVSQLAVLQAQFMVEDDDLDSAKKLIKKQLDQLNEINDSDRANEETTLASVRMLRSLTTSDRGNDPWRDEYIEDLNEAVAAAIERFPGSLRLQTDYADTQYMMITIWGQDDPEATKQRMELVAKKLGAFASSNPSVEATLRRLEIRKQRMESVKPVASLVGKPAPEWEIDAWVGGPDTTRESLKGKVVLVDFWAMWCGPCIATFPHLREWREEFGEQGFEIVGVTQYYNFEWDEETKRASRATAEVGAWDEQRALSSFLKHHKLEHPVFVAPKDSEMSSEYGVRGIPHVVLIDRDGVVQLVKTGAGQATAAEIQAKIKELIADNE